MRALTVAIAATVVTLTPALADLRDDVRICSIVADDAGRLKCFDLIAKEASNPRTAGKPEPSVPATTTVPAIPLSKATSVKKLTPSDLAVETHKWDGLVIETSLNCFYADVSEYRCFDARTFARVRLDFSELDPAGAEFLTKNCDTSDASGSRKCFVKIRFTYDTYDRQDVGGLSGNLTFVHPVLGRGEILR